MDEKLDQASNPPVQNQEPREDEAPPSLLMEFLYFLRENKKWWLIPLVVMFLILGLLIVLGTNPATAPFLYPML